VNIGVEAGMFVTITGGNIITGVGGTKVVSTGIPNATHDVVNADEED
jgi:hypothetical protein